MLIGVERLDVDAQLAGHVDQIVCDAHSGKIARQRVVAAVIEADTERFTPELVQRDADIDTLAGDIAAHVCDLVCAAVSKAIDRDCPVNARIQC